MSDIEIARAAKKKPIFEIGDVFHKFVEAILALFDHQIFKMTQMQFHPRVGFSF